MNLKFSTWFQTVRHEAWPFSHGKIHFCSPILTGFKGFNVGTSHLQGLQGRWLHIRAYGEQPRTKLKLGRTSHVSKIIQNSFNQKSIEKSSLVDFPIVDSEGCLYPFVYFTAWSPVVQYLCAQVHTKPSSLYNLVLFRPTNTSANNFLSSQCINIINNLGSLQKHGQRVEALAASPLPADQHDQILTLRHHAWHHFYCFLPTRGLTFWKPRATLVFSFKWTLLCSNYAIPEPLVRTRLEACVKVVLEIGKVEGQETILETTDSIQAVWREIMQNETNTATTGAFSLFHSEGMPKRQQWISQRQDENPVGLGFKGPFNKQHPVIQLPVLLTGILLWILEAWVVFRLQKGWSHGFTMDSKVIAGLIHNFDST